MRPRFINRQNSARPITSPEKGLSRWSRRVRTTLTDPDTIDGPGALIFIAPCDGNATIPVPVATASDVAVPVGMRRPKSPRHFESVRISGVPFIVTQVRPAPARAESRDATERSRAGSRSRTGRCRPAQADGGRSEGARPSLRARAVAIRPTRRRRGAGVWWAPRRGLVVGASGRPMLPAAAVPGAASRRQGRPGALRGASLTPVQTLPIFGKGNSVPLKKNTGVFL